MHNAERKLFSNEQRNGKNYKFLKFKTIFQYNLLQYIINGNSLLPIHLRHLKGFYNMNENKNIPTYSVNHQNRNNNTPE